MEKSLKKGKKTKFFNVINLRKMWEKNSRNRIEQNKKREIKICVSKRKYRIKRNGNNKYQLIVSVPLK